MGQSNSKKEKGSTQKSTRKAKVDIRKTNIGGHGASATTKPNPAKTTKVIGIDSARVKREPRSADAIIGYSTLLPSPQYTRVDHNSTSGDRLEELTETSNTAFTLRDTPHIPPQLNTRIFDANTSSSANFRDTTAFNSTSTPSSPPIHPPTRHLSNAMAKMNYREGDMDKLRGGFSSMELQALEDTNNVENNMKIGNPSFHNLTPGVSDDNEHEEPRLPRLPPNSATEEQYKAYDGPDQEYINYLFAVVGNITDELAKIPTANGKIALRMKTLKNILDARKTVIRDCLNFIHPAFPTIETDWHIHDTVMNFASRPICPWSYLRELVNSNEFRIMAIQLEQNVIWLVETFNRLITSRGKVNNGEDLCKKVAEILILHLQPSLRLENYAVPKVGHVLEKIDSFVDPACFSPDEDEPLELAKARGLWKKFYFVEKVAAMDVANKNDIFDSSHGTNNPEDEGDQIPYFFALEDRYLKQVASLQFQGEEDDMALVFTSKSFGAIADHFESDIDDFLVRLDILGATCRKKVLIMAVFEWLICNSGLQSARTFTAEAEGADVAAANLDVLFGPATDEEIEDAFRLVAAGGIQHDSQETDADGDQMMDA